MKTTFMPVADLIAAARAMLAEPASQSAQQSLKEALAQIDRCGTEQEEYAGAIERAREEYASDEIEIDDDPFLSIGDDGVFVNAWVWVAHEGDQDGE